MVTVTVYVSADCEALSMSLPRGWDYEFLSDDYNEDGSGTVIFAVHNITELTAAMEMALNTHDGVVSWESDE